MLPYNTLKIGIDTESINSVSQSRKEIIDRLLLYHNNTYYDFVRSAYDSSPNVVSNIPKIQHPAVQKDQQLIEMIAKQALGKSRLSDGEKGFLLLICKYSGLCDTLGVMDTGQNIEDKLFITENEDLLSRRYSFDRKVSLESFFPGIRLVNLWEGLEIMDIFTKAHDLFCSSPNTNARMEKGYWYWIYFRWRVPHYNVPLPKSSTLTAPNDILHALGKRACYLLIAVDELGKLHYFGSEEIMILYHFNYIISLITGIFDNLAIHTYERYGIRFPSDNIPSRISLYNKVGGEFLQEVGNKEPDLRNHIRDYGNFITLIYRLRERVIHAEGLKEIGFFYDFKMSSAILIDSDIDGLMRACGDKPGPYKKLSEWGVYKYTIPGTIGNHFYLNPYYFAKSAVGLLLRFADEYLKLAGHTKFLDTLNDNDNFYQEITAFGQLSLKGIER